MKPYGNRSGKSGVVAYELLPGGIRVAFAGGEVYLYTFRSAGKEQILRMQQLAEAGKGLSTFISRYVKDAFVKRRN